MKFCPRVGGGCLTKPSCSQNPRHTRSRVEAVQKSVYVISHLYVFVYIHTHTHPRRHLDRSIDAQIAEHWMDSARMDRWIGKEMDGNP